MKIALIFSLVKYLLAALIVAYFSKVFMKKREVMTDIDASKLEKQLHANVRLHKLLMETKHHIAPSQLTEMFYNEFIDRMPFKKDPTLNSYPICFDSQERLADYYYRILHEKRRDFPFLDYKSNVLLDDLTDWLEELNGIVEAFARVEANPKWKYSSDIQKRNISLLVKVLGLALQNDTDHFVDKLSKRFHKKLQNPRISSWRGKTCLDKFHNYLCMKYETKFDRKNNRKRTISWIYFNVLHPLYGRSQLCINSKKGYLSLVLMLVHYSPDLSPEQYFSYPREKAFSLMKDFHSVLAQNFK